MTKVTSTRFLIKYVWKNMGICSIILMSMILPGFLLSDYMRELDYIPKSEPCEATVTGKRIGHDKRNQNKKEYRIQYRYKTPDGAIISSGDKAGRYRWEKLKEGDSIGIRRLKDAPSKSRAFFLGLLFDPLSYEISEIFVPFILTPLLLAEGIWLLLIVRRDKESIEDIITKGEESAGKITKAVFNGDPAYPCYEIGYEFRIESGRTYHSSFFHPVRREGDPHPEPGDEGSAMYDKADPDRSVWTGSDWTQALDIKRRKTASKIEKK